MWIAKGTLLGLWLFSFGTLAWFWKLFGYTRNSAISVNLVASLTVYSVSWWLALVACLGLGLIVARSWPGRPILWVSLAITELLPIGILAFILSVVGKMKAMTK